MKFVNAREVIHFSCTIDSLSSERSTMCRMTKHSILANLERRSKFLLLWSRMAINYMV